MAIAGKNRKTSQVIVDSKDKLDNFDNNIVVDRNQENSIYKYINYIDGKILEVDYYSFIRGNSGENTLIDPNDDTQQYAKIKQLQLTITSAITPSAYTDVSFDANLMANLVPAENDILVLRLVDGRLGMFKVSDINKRSYIAKKNYDFKASFLYYSDMNKTYFDALESKVVKNYIYDKTFIGTNSAPIILESRYKDRMELKTEFDSILKSYIEEYSSERVIAYKDKENVIFDSNIQDVVMSIVSDTEYVKIKNIESNFSGRSIVSDILEKSTNVKKIDKMYYNIERVSYDIALEQTISLLSARVTHSIKLVSSASPSTYRDLSATLSKIIPDNYRLSSTNLYLFSSGFYDLNQIGILNELSLLESLLVKYLNTETISYDDLFTIIDDIDNWNYTEVFYYTPFLLLLINYSMLNSYSRI